MNLKESKNIKEIKNGKVKMYHVSLDLGTGEKIFSPRVPQNRCNGENSDIKRVCVAKSIEDAISGFPYKDYIVNKYNARNKFLSVYEIEVDRKDVIFSEDLYKYVPDAHISNECWITKEVVGVGRIINIRNITLNNYNKYANYYSGRVLDLNYEELSGLYGSKLYTLVPTVDEYEELTSLMNRLGVNYKIVDSGVNRFYKYIEGYYTGMTDEEYSWWNIEIDVPESFDNFEFWSLVAKIDRHYIDIPGDYCKSGFDIEEDDLYEIDEYDIEYSIEKANEILLERHGDEYMKSLEIEQINILIKEVIKSMYAGKEYSLKVSELAFDKLSKIDQKTS